MVRENDLDSDMAVSDVLDLCKALEVLGVQIWVDGGWAVDALLGKQTRAHKDLDIVIEEKDVARFRGLMKAHGYEEIKLESARPHNFVFGDDQGHEIDVHVVVLDEQGNGIYGPVQNGETYPAGALSGMGNIADQRVRCISPEWMVKFLAPWTHKHPGKYVPAVSALCARYGIVLPEEYRQLEK